MVTNKNQSAFEAGKQEAYREVMKFANDKLIQAIQKRKELHKKG